MPRSGARRGNVYSLRYLPSFDADLTEAEDYLFEFSLAAVDRLTEAIDKQITALAGHPFMYPVYGRNKKYRIAPLPYEYLCFYRIDEESKIIEVHRLLRGMRDISSLL